MLTPSMARLPSDGEEQMTSTDVCSASLALVIRPAPLMPRTEMAIRVSHGSARPLNTMASPISGAVRLAPSQKTSPSLPPALPTEEAEVLEDVTAGKRVTSTEGTPLTAKRLPCVTQRRNALVLLCASSSEPPSSHTSSLARPTSMVGGEPSKRTADGSAIVAWLPAASTASSITWIKFSVTAVISMTRLMRPSTALTPSAAP